VGYTDAQYTKTALDPFGNILAAKGDWLDIVPWTATIGAQYNFHVFEKSAFLRLDDEFNSKRTHAIPSEDPTTTYYDPGLVPNPATNLLNLRAGVALDPFSVALFANNVLNSHPQLNLSHQDSATALYEAQTFRPLTIGLEVNFKY
jgi:hypothetical protein